MVATGVGVALWVAVFEFEDEFEEVLEDEFEEVLEEEFEEELEDVVEEADFVAVVVFVAVAFFVGVAVAFFVATAAGVFAAGVFVVTAAELLFAGIEVSAEAPAKAEIPLLPSCGGVIERTAPRPPTVPPAINNARFMPFPSFPIPLTKPIITLLPEKHLNLKSNLGATF